MAKDLESRFASQIEVSPLLMPNRGWAIRSFAAITAMAWLVARVVSAMWTLWAVKKPWQDLCSFAEIVWGCAIRLVLLVGFVVGGVKGVLSLQGSELFRLKFEVWVIFPKVPPKKDQCHEFQGNFSSRMIDTGDQRQLLFGGVLHPVFFGMTLHNIIYSKMIFPSFCLAETQSSKMIWIRSGPPSERTKRSILETVSPQMIREHPEVWQLSSRLGLTLRIIRTALRQDGGFFWGQGSYGRKKSVKIWGGDLDVYITMSFFETCFVTFKNLKFLFADWEMFSREWLP